ncbi:MAG: class I SAM-dependent methyltransferase [Chitinophagaceae bacterium]
MALLSKLIAGNKVRKSRLHDEKGNFVGWKKMITHGIPAFTTGLLRIVLNYRPEKPWISYSAISILKTKLNKQSRVLEFGSGMSTIWYSKHAGEVFSVEDNSGWYKNISKVFSAKNMNNVSYHFMDDENNYSSFMTNDNKKFDLIMIDGSHRSQCINTAIKLIKPGGIIYLDNSDKDSTEQGGDMRLAEQTLRQYADSTGSRLTTFTDFAPTQLFVQQGLMLEKSRW